MNRLSLDEFRAQTERFSGAVGQTREISPFCSGPVWQLAARDSLHSLPVEAPHHIFERDGHWVVFVQGEQPGIWFPFESAWMFGCPLVGTPEGCLDLLRTSSEETGLWRSGFCIGGVPRDGALHRLLDREGSSFRDYREFQGMESMLIDLSDGPEAWLARRSKKFRKTLRLASQIEGLEIEDARNGEPEELFDRIREIQRQTYKREEGGDILDIEQYSRFYRDMLAQLAASGNLRLLFARLEGRDIAYIFGGVSGTTYRGFQMSYVESAREWGIGNRLQWENILRSSEEGNVRYDLGMHSPYKDRWADHREDYVTVFVVV